MAQQKLFLLDAMALIYRAYYALIRNPRITTYGKNTNAQFGFTSTIFELIQKEKPTHMAVAFDTQAPTERHDTYVAYKANRQETPEDILASLPDIKRIIEAFRIPIVEKDGYEADDIIGTLAWQAAKKGFEVFMVTADKDYGQLLHNHIYIYKPPYMGNKEEILSAKDICEKWQIKDVKQVVDILGLMGDNVDNIPGIPGVGEKTAIKLIQQYHSVENVIAHADEIGGKLGEKIKANADQALMSKQLATIITDAPVEFHEEDFRLKEWNKTELENIFSELEFKTLGKRILGEDFSIAPVQADLFTSSDTTKTAQTDNTHEKQKHHADHFKTIHDVAHQYQVCDDDASIRQLVEQFQTITNISIDTETTSIDAMQAELVGMSLCIKPHEAYYIPFDANQQKTSQRLQLLADLLGRTDVCWIGHNIKYDMLVLKKYGFSLQGKYFDTLIAHYLLYPEGRRSLDDVAMQYLQYAPVSIETLIGKKGKHQGNMRDVELEKIKEYAAEDADVAFQLKDILQKELAKHGLEKVFYEIECPLIPVLAEMEFTGVKIDVDFLREYAKELHREARQLEEKIYQQAGTRFNIASPKQLGEILFDKLKLDENARTTRTGQYATGEEVLLKLASKHPIVTDILAYREITKLQSTYVEALPEMIDPHTGKIHTSYNQTVAVTGRLSSNNPNLQNIPIRTDRGREIRKAFIPAQPGHKLLSADYSQIELRIVAAISGDEHMIEAFKKGLDIHTATAARVFGVPMEQVTKEMRYRSKSVNFGIIYGQGPFGLAQNLGISRTEAKELIDHYFEQYPGIKAYMDQQIAFAKKHGYVQTLMGRKRWLPDIHSSNNTVRGYAERNAINMPIQGTAADMIKLAMIRIHQQLQRKHLQAKLILQVHDELVLDTPEKEIEEVSKIVVQEMQEALPLPHNVPVIAEVGVGNNWLEAHA
ncbi:MAG: DNA polymerase I [Thermoflavifilum sp.]|uniref:DNA polymerase I n=1 Tax=Thermoflavifilum sp. TaxID=1968839 RepID=UPI0018A49324|nr:DNA polymerase I [Thermoflavifilum sp.]QOR76986.1 MAG: DNA polymerase I [Thermoflavifilum sp.]